MRIAFAFGLTVALSSAALAQPAYNNNVTVPAAPAVAPAAVPVQPANPLAPAIAAPAALPVTPNILSASDVSLYKQAFAAARAGQLIKARALVAKVSDSALAGYVEAAAILATWRRRLPVGTYVVVTSLAYAPVRFALDRLRERDGVTSDLRWGSLTFAQWSCLALFAFGVAVAMSIRATGAALRQPDRQAAAS